MVSWLLPDTDACAAFLQECNLVGKPVFVTRVVDTMTDAPRPTRAEATGKETIVNWLMQTCMATVRLPTACLQSCAVWVQDLEGTLTDGVCSLLQQPLVAVHKKNIFLCFHSSSCTHLEVAAGRVEWSDTVGYHSCSCRLN